MVHKARKCSKKCTKHLFILKPVHHQAFMSLESKYLFCSSDKNSPPLIPQFNNDRKSFTSAFILPLNQENSKKQDDNYRIEHFRLKIEKHEQKSEMFLPKPSKKHSYCNICKKIFEDYQGHIYSFEHTTLLRKSSINDEIIHFCNKFWNNLQELQKNQSLAIKQQLKTHQFPKEPEGLNTHQRFKQLIQNLNSSQQGWQRAIKRSFDIKKLKQQKQEQNNLNDRSLRRPTKNGSQRRVGGNFRLCIPTATSLKESC